MQRFTLVELMIVVAIISVLAAIALPNFYVMQLRAKRAELDVNVDGIGMAERAYEASHDTFVWAAIQPDNTPGKAPRPWVTDADWTALGWSPDGDVRGSYVVNSSNECPGGFPTQVCSSELDCFWAFGVSDLDAAGDPACVRTGQSGSLERVSDLDTF